MDGENNTDSKKIDYRKLNLIAREKLHRLKADKVINSFVDKNKVVFESDDLTILNFNLTQLEREGRPDRVIDASIKILEELKSDHDAKKTFGQNLIYFDETIRELKGIKESCSEKCLYPSLPLENDPLKETNESQSEELKKKQEEIKDFGKSLLDNNRSRVDDLREKIKELKNLNHSSDFREYINKQREVTEMAENLIKERGSSIFNFSSTRDKKIDYSKKLQECLGDDASLVRKVGKNGNGQTVIDAKSIFDREEEKKMATRPTTAPRTRPGPGPLQTYTLQ